MSMKRWYQNNCRVTVPSTYRVEPQATTGHTTAAPIYKTLYGAMSSLVPLILSNIHGVENPQSDMRLGEAALD